MVKLEQEKLDATAKKRANKFNWRGQFTPEFVEYLLVQFSKKGDHILDPFSGSGTVLQEAASLNLEATGFEINPSAHSMSSFFGFSNLTLEERNELFLALIDKLQPIIDELENVPVYCELSDYREAYTHLLSFINDVKSILENEKEKVLFLNIAFQTEKDKKLILKDSLNKSIAYISKCLIDLPYSDKKISANLADARVVGDMLPNTIDLILTSPPYINVFNYHQNYRAIVEEFDFDILKVAHSEFGSNRKNRGNRFKTVTQYCLDMELAIRSFWKSLKKDGKVILVVGRESNVRGVPFYNSEMVINILEQCGGFANANILERQFVNKFGISIKEDIIVVQKSKDELSSDKVGAGIAIEHLKKSLLKVDKQDIQKEINEAIDLSENLRPSPFLSLLNVQPV